MLVDKPKSAVIIAKRRARAKKLFFLQQQIKQAGVLTVTCQQQFGSDSLRY